VQLICCSEADTKWVAVAHVPNQPGAELVGEGDGEVGVGVGVGVEVDGDGVGVGVLAGW
jgi:hypothetical protein